MYLFDFSDAICLQYQGPEVSALGLNVPLFKASFEGVAF